ncbi:MAG: TonB-dependent receptor, partial [Acidobacteriota bacterium]
RTSAGRRFKNGLDLALSGTYEHSDGVERLYFPIFDTPATNNGIAQGRDGEGVRQFYGRLGFNGLSLTTAYGTRKRDVPTASFSTLFNQRDPGESTTDRHTLIDADYGRLFSGTRVTFRGSFDRFTYDGIYPLGSPDGALLVAHDSVVGMRWSAGSGVTRSLPGRQTARAGVEFIDNVTQDQRTGYVDPPVTFADTAGSSSQQAVYLQDEIKLGPRVIVNAGLRYDHYEEFARVSPRAALIVLPSPTQSLKYLYGSAFRAPNAYETNETQFGPRVLDLRPETIDTHEFVWEHYANDWLRTSASAYFYTAERLITLIADSNSFLEATFINQGEVRAKGLELEVQMRLLGGSRALVSYAVQSAVDQETHLELPNSPRRLAQARISIPGPTAGSYLSVDGQYLSARSTVSGARTGAVALANLTITQPLGRTWEIFGQIRNVFDARYTDPVSSLHTQDVVPQNGRTARIGLRLRLWGK